MTQVGPSADVIPAKTLHFDSRRLTSRSPNRAGSRVRPSRGTMDECWLSSIRIVRGVEQRDGNQRSDPRISKEDTAIILVFLASEERNSDAA